MKAIKPCQTESRRHTWEYERTATVTRATKHTASIQLKGLYRCVTCRATKLGWVPVNAIGSQ